jgi:hypothetical protein
MAHPSEEMWLTRFVLLRLLGLVYAVAFLAAINQALPLMGSDGLTPLPLYVERLREALGSTSAGFLRLPSLFWFWHSDTALLVLAWTGLALACVVLAGYANALILAALWLIYMSFVHLGQVWYGYGWEVQLLETGFLAIFLCPLLDPRPFPRRPPPVVVLWLFRWLAFRVMLGAGLIKVRGDPAWRDLTALYYHFETQPIPNALSRGFHFLPRLLLRLGVQFNFVAELVAPFFVFWPRVARHAAGLIIIAFQITLIAGGNLSFLNWLTIIPALACLDDIFWARILPRSLVSRAERAEAEAEPSRPMQVTALVVAGLVALLSVRPVENLVSPGQIMNTSFDPLSLVNTYGAFGTVGRERLTLVLEGTNSEYPGERAVWIPYLYKAQPVALDQRPRQVAPYQPRLDWQMWFAAMGTPQQYPWTLNLIWKLLHNDPVTLRLFAGNPFPSNPPRYIRAVVYKYRFAQPGNPEGLYWNRESVGLWLPPLSADNAKLQSYVRESGWIPDGSTKP